MGRKTLCNIEVGKGCHGEGIYLPVRKGSAAERNGFGNALGFAAHGGREVDTRIVGYEDVEGGGVGGAYGEGGFLVAAVEFADQVAVEVYEGVVVELVDDEIAGDAGGEFVAI